MPEDNGTPVVAREMLEGPSTQIATRPRLPLPPPERGGTAPRLELPPLPPPAARPFRFGTQPRVVMPEPLASREAPGAEVHTGEFDRMPEGGVDINLASLCGGPALAPDAEASDEHEAGELMPSLPRLPIPLPVALPPRRTLRWAGPLAAIAVMLLLLFVARPLRHADDAPRSAAAARALPAPVWRLIGTMRELAWELARAIRSP
jgi:hypothetical protein